MTDLNDVRPSGKKWSKLDGTKLFVSDNGTHCQVIWVTPPPTPLATPQKRGGGGGGGGEVSGLQPNLSINFQLGKLSIAKLSIQYDERENWSLSLLQVKGLTAIIFASNLCHYTVNFEVQLYVSLQSNHSSHPPKLFPNLVVNYCTLTWSKQVEGHVDVGQQCQERMPPGARQNHLYPGVKQEQNLFRKTSKMAECSASII